MASEQEIKSIKTALAGTVKPIIIELGALFGEEYAWMEKEFNPLGKYLAVEADPRNCALFRQRLPTLNLIEGAVAAKTGPVEFHQCDNDKDQAFGSGSIRAPKKHLEFFPWCRFDSKITVNGISLDSLYRARGLDSGVDLLWVDIQGAEKDAINGGGYALSRTRYMMIEAEEHEFYEGQALKTELLAMLPNWEVVQDFGFNLLLRRKDAA